MSEIERINKTMSLQEEKELLERKLLSINKDIELNQSKCSHVGVYMGNYGEESVCKCVLCNSNLNNEQMEILTANNLVIYAHNYLNYVKSNYLEKFDTIQTMYLGICKGNRFVDNKEIVCIFQEMINKSIDSKEKDTTLTNYQEGTMSFMDENIFKGAEIDSQEEIKGPIKELKKEN